jgi:hypothetical protein
LVLLVIASSVPEIVQATPRAGAGNKLDRAKRFPIGTDVVVKRLKPEEDHSPMDSKSRFLSSVFLAGALMCSVFGVACGHPHYYRVYDPYYSDYHVWNDSEVTYYHQWAHENHRDENRDFRKIPAGEQKEYWTWRHSHGG